MTKEKEKESVEQQDNDYRRVCLTIAWSDVTEKVSKRSTKDREYNEKREESQGR